MARLYSRTGAVAHDQPGYDLFKADAKGGFDFPDELSDELRSFHIRKMPMWEDELERQARVAAEEQVRMRDPATLAALVAELVKAQATPAETAPGPKAAPAAKAAAK